MNKMDDISILKLFNEKVDKLINSRFVRHIQENKGLKVSIKSSVGEKVGISHNLPDQDAIDAFILTVRFFIQNNEPTSLCNMAKLYSNVSVSSSIRNDYTWVRNKLNSELSKKSMFNLNGKELTRGEIFDTVIYGGLAHAQKDKKEDFDKWMKFEPLAAFIIAEFNNVLIYFLDCIAYARKVNLRALEELNS